MKSNIVTGLFILISLAAKTQVSLPYETGFDNVSQQAGWVEFKTAATTFSHWEYTDANPYSSPLCVYHDFSPSTGITLTDNWFVSPAFSIPTGGVLDTIRYLFSGFSEPSAGDTVAIYLLNGNQDPSLATAKILLFDFRGSEYNPDDMYRFKTDIDLPAYDGLSYLAIRYRNSDCSSNWLTVYFDNVAIKGGTVGLSELELESNHVSIFPNPTNGVLNIDSQLEVTSIQIFNLNGKNVYSIVNFDSKNSIDLSELDNGFYIIKINSEKGVYTEKIILN